MWLSATIQSLQANSVSCAITTAIAKVYVFVGDRGGAQQNCRRAFSVSAAYGLLLMRASGIWRGSRDRATRSPSQAANQERARGGKERSDPTKLSSSRPDLQKLSPVD